jgi:hypothetical protein
MRNLFFAALVCFSPAFVVTACSTQQPAPQVQYVTRTVTECVWAPKAIYKTSYPIEVKQWMVAYETARQTNCQDTK